MVSMGSKTWGSCYWSTRSELSIGGITQWQWLSWRAKSSQTDWECKNPDLSASCEGKEGCQHWEWWVWCFTFSALRLRLPTLSAQPHHIPQPLWSPLLCHCPLALSKGQLTAGRKQWGHHGSPNSPLSPPRHPCVPQGMLPILPASGRTQKRF